MRSAYPGDPLEDMRPSETGVPQKNGCTTNPPPLTDVAGPMHWHRPEN